MSGNRSKLAFFDGGWVTLSADFREKGASPTNHCWCQKTRVIAVLCGIKIFAVRCLVLSQYMHLTEGRTDRQAELRQQYRALHYMQSHGKNSFTYRWYWYACQALGNNGEDDSHIQTDSQAMLTDSHLVLFCIH